MLNLQFSEIKELVLHYQIKNDEKEETSEKKIFNISFDKDKIHNLFYQRGIAYSDITKNEIYLLPILKENEQLNIYSKNYFYDNWNLNNDFELVEFKDLGTVSVIGTGDSFFFESMIFWRNPNDLLNSFSNSAESAESALIFSEIFFCLCC